MNKQNYMPGYDISKKENKPLLLQSSKLYVPKHRRNSSTIQISQIDTNETNTPASDIEEPNVSFANYSNGNEPLLTNSPEYSTNPFKNYVYEFSPDYDKDISYLVFLYPKESRIIRDVVNDELDKYEYDGSTIFHEYPDRVYLEAIINDIYLRVSQRTQQPNNFNENMTSNNVLNNNNFNCLLQLIHVMFYYELINRRRRYKLIKSQYSSQEMPNTNM